MSQILACLFFVLFNAFLSKCVDLYHVQSKVTYVPAGASKYFGYTLAFSNTRLIVGAPKSPDQNLNSTQTGLVFKCDYSDLSRSKISCEQIGVYYGRFRSTRSDFFKDDMWYGATLLPLQPNKLVICAPRWTDWLNEKREHLLALGACYTQTVMRPYSLIPLNEPSRNAFLIDGSRPEFGGKNTHINFYAYGQAGFSAKVVDDHRIIVGAPGLLMWTGAIVEYGYTIMKDSNDFYFSKKPTSNPYYTKELMMYDYFGYSVESGSFDNSSGILYVAGAPRSQMGFGGVFVFEPSTRETDPIRIRSQLKGPHLGSYFGATLCCTDLNQDGRSDLLVGAPTFTKMDGTLQFDQGVVFVYLSTGEGETLNLLESVFVTGSSKSGSRFGTSIADLGDVDGDGYTDIAIGAPFEDDGRGVVYIYRGDEKGLRPNALQRITSEGRGFGFSIAKGFDVDSNKCNDLAVGAFNSESVYLYRCVPTVRAEASIVVPDAVDLSQNTTSFKVIFCVNTDKSYLWPGLEVDFKAKIRVDKVEARAMITGDDEYKVKVMEGSGKCEEQTVEVKPTADLSKPISLKINLEHIQAFTDSSEKFDKSAVRISDDSILEKEFQIQLTRDCGEDLICKPFLVMSLDLLDRKPYAPGSNAKLGAKVTIVNKEEPAFGAKVHLTLPFPPKRLPDTCTLKELNVTCNVPAPLRRNEVVSWEFELEYTQMYGVEEKQMKVNARMEDAFYSEDISDPKVEEVVLRIVPVADFALNGKALPNVTVPVSRQKFYDKSVVNVVHYYEVINYGPSDWTPLIAEIRLPKNVTLSKPIQGCDEIMEFVHCVWSAPARVSLPIIVTLKVDLRHHGEMLEEKGEMNITTTIILDQHNKTAAIMSTLLLDPAAPVWPLALAVATGFVVLGAIVFGLYKIDFFSRESRDRLRILKGQEVNEMSSEPSSSEAVDPGTHLHDASTQELLCDSD